MSIPTRPITCACCGTAGLHHSRGLIRTCYERRRCAGTLTRFPRLFERAEPWRPLGSHGRKMVARYQELAAIRPPLSLARVAWELGVSERSVQRYATASRLETQTDEAAA
ncbi:hypothetical protein ACIBHY_17005 [Nonomuraea sp. NPDC050547]|uniref:hypothetical protein n=1 Tax=Nonomuraea sp. NPDC050547 TaxID=3364368 RepID=UPI0037896F8C